MKIKKINKHMATVITVVDMIDVCCCVVFCPSAGSDAHATMCCYPNVACTSPAVLELMRATASAMSTSAPRSKALALARL